MFCKGFFSAIITNTAGFFRDLHNILSEGKGGVKGGRRGRESEGGRGGGEYLLSDSHELVFIQLY